MKDVVRLACAVPDLRVADTKYNTERVIEKITEAEQEGCAVLVTPELAATGYTVSDLLFSDTLKQGVRDSIGAVCKKTAECKVSVFFGAPIVIENELFNAALFIKDGSIQGVSVKTFLPNYSEFYEKRWFSSAFDLPVEEVSAKDLYDAAEDYMIPIGNDLIYRIGDMKIAAEICEDAWAPVTPSARYALAGAEVIVNLSASNELIGKRDFRRDLISMKSSELSAVYLYVSSGAGESTTDLVFSGHGMIAQNGRILKENDKVCDNDYLLVADVDLGKTRADRIKVKTFKDTEHFANGLGDCRELVLPGDLPASDGSYLFVKRHPFIPRDEVKRSERCKTIFDMQVAGLIKRLSVTGTKMVVGVSGGMDSTLALLVAASALKKLSAPMTDLHGITMPAFGTTGRTKNNALELMQALGITMKEIPIGNACLSHFEDIGHDPEVRDITYENAQARERTQVLMDYANQIGAIVVGTGDLSELALGWCTYNGDQMSMYGVNGSIPKTLIRWMIESVARYDYFPGAKDTLLDIVDTPISPELLPPDQSGNIAQKTEDSIGPYELHDFFLYYSMRYGFGPAKIFALAKKAFADDYTDETIYKWLRMFFKRFFTQQFKRSAMPDGVKVGTVSLSPRGDLRMPSDASSAIWLAELDTIQI